MIIGKNLSSIYQNPSGAIIVKLDNGQIWLTQDQIAELFGRSVSTINEHIKNIYNEKEVLENATLRKFGNSENTISKPKNYYNLELILSVGYRVNSESATKFRQWSNVILADYIKFGFCLNKDRLFEITDKVKILIQNKPSGEKWENEKNTLEYINSLITLNRFDEDRLDEIWDDENINVELDKCRIIIQKVKTDLISLGEAWDGFGREIDNKFNATIGAINQTFDGKPVYNRTQKLANLLYLIVKNHSFVDGNKRIGALLFMFFCQRNNLKVDMNNLINLTLLVAGSNPKDKDNIIKLIQNTALKID